MARLLFLCDTFPPRHGGSERMLCEMARAAVALGHEVTVLTPTGYNLEWEKKVPNAPAPAGPAPEQEEAFDRGEPYTVVRSRAWRGFFDLGGHRVAAIGRIARTGIILHLICRLLLLKKRPDALVIGHVLPLGTIAALVGKWRRIPYGVMTYGEEVSVYSRSPRMRRMLVHALSSARVVGCLTADSKRELAELAPDTISRIQVLVPPASLPSQQQWEFELRSYLNSPEARRFLLTVARLVPRKGIDVALHAFRSVAREFPDLGYLVVGSGPDLPRLEALAQELGIAERIGFVTSAETTAPFYHACTAFVMPNRTMPDGEREGYGIVFLEAALAGKPAIAGDSGGARDAVIHEVTGLLVPPEDPEAVAAAMRKLLREPALGERLGAAGRSRAEEISSSQAVLRQTDAFLNAIREE